MCNLRIPVKTNACPIQTGHLSGQSGHPLEPVGGVARGIQSLTQIIVH
jgi:hypothetical protein